MVKLIYSLLAIVFMVSFTFAPVANAATAIPVSLIFTEVKVRADSANLQDTDEFIELFNASLTPLSLSDYVMEYFNTTIPTETQIPTQKAFSDKILAPGGQLILAKQPTKIINSIATPFNSLSDTGGRLRLVTMEGDIIDEVAWTNVQSSATGTGVYPAIVHQCNTSNAVCNANRIQSFSRQQTTGLYVLDHPMWQLGVMSPVSNELLPVVDEPPTEPESPVEEPTQEPVPTSPTPTCEGVVISELLPNAKGSDIGKEFIELHNPDIEPISLLGCSLQVSSSSKTYQFEDVTLAPDAYLALSDQTTGLTLPNAAGATVWLLTPQKELQTVTYIGDLDEEVAWANVADVWQATYSPTPGLINVALAEKPCAPGQERNVLTGDCEKIVTTAIATLTPCKTGQERNPDTNRCRTVVTAAALISCKTGQERNPETNRCRAVQGVSILQPCDEGEERNPETNRCRKVTDPSATNIAKVTDVTSTSATGGSKLWLLMAAVVLVVGYGIYEWRQDLALFFSSVMSKLHR